MYKTSKYFYPLQVEKQYQYPYHLHFHQKEYVLHLPTYQVSNLTLALNVVDYLCDLNDEDIQAVIDDFKWPCRFEQFGHLYLDGAHNISGIEALIQTIKEESWKMLELFLVL